MYIFKKYCQSQVTLSDFISYKKQMKPIVSVVREILRKKFQVLQKLSKID